ncbi:uncharacterized protein LOC144580388 [Callithrix jacchus]
MVAAAGPARCRVPAAPRCPRAAARSGPSPVRPGSRGSVRAEARARRRRTRCPGIGSPMGVASAPSSSVAAAALPRGPAVSCSHPSARSSPARAGGQGPHPQVGWAGNLQLHRRGLTGSWRRRALGEWGLIYFSPVPGCSDRTDTPFLKGWWARGQKEGSA